MDRSKLAVGAAWVVTLALVAWLVVRVVWFFNPFTFRQDEVWGEANDRTLKITDQRRIRTECDVPEPRWQTGPSEADG